MKLSINVEEMRTGTDKGSTELKTDYVVEMAPWTKMMNKKYHDLYR